MVANLLSLGLFQEEGGYQFSYLNHRNLKSNFEGIAFKFTLTYEEPNRVQAFQCLFNPIKVETKFYILEAEININEFEIVPRQPSFFVFLVPFPIIKQYNSYVKKFTSFSFINRNSYYSSAKNFYTFPEVNKNSFEENISNTLRICTGLNEGDQINDFFQNNCTPLFVSSESELSALINGYSRFIKETLGTTLSIESYSKSIIPFFKITNEDLRYIIQDDDLPF